MNLSWLIFLACPLGMGLMMWIMMRGNQDQQGQRRHEAPSTEDIASLRRQLESLENQQKATLAQMRRLSEPKTNGAEPSPSSPGRLTDSKSLPESDVEVGLQQAAWRSFRGL